MPLSLGIGSGERFDFIREKSERPDEKTVGLARFGTVLGVEHDLAVNGFGKVTQLKADHLSQTDPPATFEFALFPVEFGNPVTVTSVVASGIKIEFSLVEIHEIEKVWSWLCREIDRDC